MWRCFRVEVLMVILVMRTMIVVIIVMSLTPDLCTCFMLRKWNLICPVTWNAVPNIFCHRECFAKYFFCHLECCAKYFFNRWFFLCSNVMDGQVENALWQLFTPIPLQLGRWRKSLALIWSRSRLVFSWSWAWEPLDFKPCLLSPDYVAVWGTLIESLSAS